MEQVNVDALMRLARALLPPQFILVTRPENETQTREAVAESEYADLIELVVDTNIPEDKVILIRKDASWKV